MINDEIVQISKQYSMTNVKNLLETVNVVNTLDKNLINGDIVECGVWKGGHIIAAMLAGAVPRKYWLFDTFDGMGEFGPFDFRDGAHVSDQTRYKKIGLKNWCRAAIDEVKQNINLYKKEYQSVEYVIGPVEKTLKEDRLPEKISLLRLDTDFYSSTKIELEVLWERIVPSGILIIDDYNSWDGCKKACDEFFKGEVIFEKIVGPAVKVIKK